MYRWVAASGEGLPRLQGREEAEEERRGAEGRLKSPEKGKDPVRALPSKPRLRPFKLPALLLRGVRVQCMHF